MGQVERAKAEAQYLWVRADGKVSPLTVEQASHAKANCWQLATLPDVVAYYRSIWRVFGEPSNSKPALHQGEHAWVLGSGPTLTEQPLDLLKGRLTIGINRILRADLPFDPTYIAICDDDVLMMERQPLSEYLRRGGRLLLLGRWRNLSRECLRYAEPGNVHFFDKAATEGWSHDLNRGFASNFSTAFLALQYLAWTGASVANMVGIDMAHAPDGRTHFFGTVPLNVAIDSRIFMAAKACFTLSLPEMERAGMRCVSCSPVFDVAGYPHATLEESVALADHAAVA